MEKFADCIPEFPRRSPGIFTLHHRLISMKARLEEYGRRLRRLPSKAESWEGSARGAFDRALAGEVRQTGRLNEGLEEGARAIRTFAYAAENAERKIDAARAGMRALDRQVDAVPDEDPDHPERARTVFVERTYLRGANGGSPGVVSILEAAYGQMYEGGTRGNSVFGPTGISAGEPSAVMEEITGKDTTIIKKGTWGFGDGYNDDQRKDIQQALKNHRPVVANTITRIVGFQNSEFIKEVSVHGEKHRIQIMRNHSYVVVAADKDGVTVRNPWGHSYDSDGNKQVEYAEFKMSWDDFGASFGNVHVGGGYPK